eukprot:TRINITY_DN28012_c0_g1_i1.p1 TRINITY_DN28012_c0_g1~~TRINITY_DN28012_c0_g1_i1.p1  ORF type:complete len:239 (+),score=55.74 TRINITY_DN28012_c0_g1_i1:106-822(+)
MTHNLCVLFFFKDTATTEIYTLHIVGSVRCVQETGLKPYNITKKKIARTFQNIRLFSNLTVLDNVKVSFNYRINYSLFDSIFRTPKFRKTEAEIIEKSVELLKVFSLDIKKDELASNLPYGEQRKLEIVRALAAEPSLLLLDEPAAGMNPQETVELMDLINWIKDKFHISILLIEHDMKLVMGICDKIAVLDYGKKIAEGTPEEIKNNPKVIEAYLGEEAQICQKQIILIYIMEQFMH